MSVDQCYIGTNDFQIVKFESDIIGNLLQTNVICCHFGLIIYKVQIFLHKQLKIDNNMYFKDLTYL